MKTYILMKYTLLVSAWHDHKMGIYLWPKLNWNNLAHWFNKCAEIFHSFSQHR